MIQTLIASSDPTGFGAAAGGDSLNSPGWLGFLNYVSMLQELGALVLATVLALLIAFHPTTRRTVDTIEEAELPKVYIMYALVGAVVGVVVLQFGLVVGFVIFGLGGLMRFRTETGSTRDTGRLIVVTLVGLISGLNLPHFAVIATVFAWILIYIFDGKPVCQLEVKDLQPERAREASDAYRAVLRQFGCTFLGESKGVAKGKVVLVFRAPRKFKPATIRRELRSAIPPDLLGEMEWKIE